MPGNLAKVAKLGGTCGSASTAVPIYAEIAGATAAASFCHISLQITRGRQSPLWLLLKCVLSAIFSPQPPSTSASNSNHHSPPLLAGSNSPSFFVCKGPLLSSLRRALIRSATLNKEGKMEREVGGRERERAKDTERQSSGGDIRVSINRARAAAKGP